MRRREIERQFDAIVDFSGVEKFLDTPVKRYSSGMYVRLAFAVAAHLEPEILLVDEVLAVGDAEFQRKCLGKMRDVADSGRTVLFVSHHMQSVRGLCSKALYLERGEKAEVTTVEDGIDRYMKSFTRETIADTDPTSRYGTGEYRTIRVKTGKDAFECGEPKTIEFTIKRFEARAVGKLFFSIHIVDQSGVMIANCDSRFMDYFHEPEDEIDVKLEFKTPWLKPGSYRVDIFVCNINVLDRYENACQLEVLPLLPYPSVNTDEFVQSGLLYADFEYS